MLEMTIKEETKLTFSLLSMTASEVRVAVPSSPFPSSVGIVSEEFTVSVVVSAVVTEDATSPEPEDATSPEPEEKS